MKIMLTGGRGMVGHNIIEALKKIENVELYAPNSEELDLCNYEAVVQYLKSIMPDLIIHSAGKVGGIQANIKDPFNFYILNLDMGRNIVMAAFNLGIKKFLNLGSSCMYPRNCNGFLTEDMVLKGELEPTNEGYAIAKSAIGKLCEYISITRPDYHYKTLVPCNLYGKWDKFGEENSHLIPAVIKKLHNAKITGQDVVEIWGTGNARREFMYAEDLAIVISKCLDKIEILPVYMNVGLGFDYSIDEYYQIVAKVVGYKGSFKHDLSKPEGMKRKLVSVEKEKQLGLYNVTELEDGIRQTYNYYLHEILKEG